MAALVVETKSKSEMKLVREVLKKMGIASKRIVDSDREDFALGMLIDQADRTEKVSREQIMKKLGRVKGPL